MPQVQDLSVLFTDVTHAHPGTQHIAALANHMEEDLKEQGQG